MTHSLVSLGKKLAVYFLNSQLGARLQGLIKTFAARHLPVAKISGPVAVTPGPCCPLCCGKDGQRVLGSDLVSCPDTEIRNRFCFSWIPRTIALRLPLQSDLAWRYSSSYPVSPAGLHLLKRVRIAPCLLLWPLILSSLGLSTCYVQ